MKPKILKDELKIDEDAAELIEACLQLDPKKRKSAKQLLQMKFFEGVSSDPFDVSSLFQNKIDSLLKKGKDKMDIQNDPLLQHD